MYMFPKNLQQLKEIAICWVNTNKNLRKHLYVRNTKQQKSKELFIFSTYYIPLINKAIGEVGGGDFQ